MFKKLSGFFSSMRLKSDLKKVRNGKIELKEMSDEVLESMFRECYSNHINKGENTMNDSYTGADLILYERGYEAGLSGHRMDVYDDDDPYDQGVKDAVDALSE